MTPIKKIVLGVETSCDETGLSLVEASGGIHAPQFLVLKNLVTSQVKIHAPFGGVVPNLAKREHVKNLPVLLRKILGISKSEFLISKQNSSSKFKIPKIDMIAATVGPGLEPALWAGITFAKKLGKELKIPVIGANHLEGHLYSFLLPRKSSRIEVRGSKKKSNRTSNISSISNISNIFPAIALIVSGGHTILLKMDSLAKWKKLGETRDDAVGEAFDKVARLLGLLYPGGPALEKLALSLPKGRKPSINFPRPMMHHKSYDFSFSGLKTAVLYYLRDTNIRMRANDTNSTNKTDIAASFQQAAIHVLITKTLRAAKEFRAKSVMLSGGVAANKFLRRALSQEARKAGLAFFVPEFNYNTDNAAMIAAAGYLAHLRGKKYKLVARGDLTI